MVGKELLLEQEYGQRRFMIIKGPVKSINFKPNPHQEFWCGFFKKNKN
jgi:hypothetical protein